jgi:hypothetical protein
VGYGLTVGNAGAPGPLSPTQIVLGRLVASTLIVLGAALATKRFTADVRGPIGRAMHLCSHFSHLLAPVACHHDNNELPSTAPIDTFYLSYNRFYRNIHILLLLEIAFGTLASGLLSPQTIF